MTVGKINLSGLINDDFEETQTEWLCGRQTTRDWSRKSKEVWEKQTSQWGRELGISPGTESLFQIPQLDSVILPRVEDDYTKNNNLISIFIDRYIFALKTSDAEHCSPNMPCGFLSYALPTVWTLSFSSGWHRVHGLVTALPLPCSLPDRKRQMCNAFLPSAKPLLFCLYFLW